MKATPKLHPQVFELATSIGDFIEYWGFKQIHGKIWTLIFLSNKPVDANYLIEKLEVSKSLISMSIKDLLEYNVIQRHDTINGTVHYQANPDIWSVIQNVLLSREAKLLVKIKSDCNKVKKINPEEISDSVSKKQLKQLAQMTGTATKTLKTFNKLKQLSLLDFSKGIT